MPTRPSARLALGAVAALALLTPLTACSGGTSYASHCGGGSCTVNLTGEQTFEVDGPDGAERLLWVGPIEPDAVTLTGYGDGVRLLAGQEVRLDGALPVQVISVGGRDVSLRLAATEVDSADDDDRDRYRAVRHDRPDVVVVDVDDRVPTTARTTAPAAPRSSARATTSTSTRTATRTSTRSASTPTKR